MLLGGGGGEERSKAAGRNAVILARKSRSAGALVCLKMYVFPFHSKSKYDVFAKGVCR